MSATVLGLYESTKTNHSTHKQTTVELLRKNKKKLNQQILASAVVSTIDTTVLKCGTQHNAAVLASIPCILQISIA